MESNVSRIEFSVSNFESRNIMNLSWERTLKKCTLTFHSKNDFSVHWVRLVCFCIIEVRALKAKMFAYGLLLKLAF